MQQWSRERARIRLLRCKPSLSLYFLICKMRIIPVDTSWAYWEEQIIPVKPLTQGLAHSKGLASDTHDVIIAAQPSLPVSPSSQFKCQLLPIPPSLSRMSNPCAQDRGFCMGLRDGTCHMVSSSAVLCPSPLCTTHSQRHKTGIFEHLVPGPCRYSGFLE